MQQPVVGVRVGPLLTGGGRFSLAWSQSRSQASQPTGRRKRGHPSAGSQVWPQQVCPTASTENTPSNGALSTRGAASPPSVFGAHTNHACVPTAPRTLLMRSESQGHKGLRGASRWSGLFAHAGSVQHPQHFAQRTAPGHQVAGASTWLACSPDRSSSVPFAGSSPLPRIPYPAASRARRPQISALIKMIAASVENSARCLRRKAPSSLLHLTALSPCWDPANSRPPPRPPLRSKRGCHAVQQGLNAGPKMWLRGKG